MKTKLNFNCKICEGTIEWHHVDNAMPEPNEYVLIETRSCRYPACVGFFNGVNWISLDEKTEISNIIHWATIKTPNKKM